MFNRLRNFFRGNSKTSRAAPLMVSGAGGGGAIWTPKRYDTFARETYMKNVIAFRCIDEIAKGAASVEWNIYTRDGKGRRKKIEDHSLIELMKRPNPNEGFPFLMIKSVAYLAISGNVFIERVSPTTGPNKSIPKELYVHRPDRFKILVDSDTGLLTGYEMNAGGKKTEWDVDPVTQQGDILHLKGFNPLHDFWGMGATEPTAREIDTANEATLWQKSLLENQGRPGMLFMFKGELSEDQQKAFEKQLNEKYNGGANAGKNMLLWGGETGVQGGSGGGVGIDVKPYGFTPQEMDWLESNRELARRIAFGYGVPPQLIGIPGDNTYCIPGSSRVSTPNGPVCIKDLKKGDTVYSFGGSKIEKKRIFKQGMTGRKTVYEIRTKNRKLRATDNHPILVRKQKKVDAPLLGRRCSKELIYYLEYVPVGELQKGDLIVQSHNLPQEKSKGGFASIEEMELFGFYTGDGYCAKPVHISDGRGYKRGGRMILAIPQSSSYSDYYVDIAQSFTGNNAIWGERCVSFAGNTALKQLESLDLLGTAKTKRIPSWVYQTSYKHKLSYLRGLLDSDGSVDSDGRATFGFASRALTEDVWHLCLSCGFQINAVTEINRDVILPNGKEFRQIFYDFMVSRAEDVLEIGSHTPEYIRRIKNNLGKNRRDCLFTTGGQSSVEKIKELIPVDMLHFASILSITSISEMDVYDITVEGNHNFIADGVVVHNSNQKEARLGFWETTILYYLMYLKSEFNNWLIEDNPEKEFMDYNLDTVPAMEPRRAERWKKAQGSDFLTINEKREMVGMEAVEAGDVILVPATMLPLEQAGIEDEVNDDVGDEGEDDDDSGDE